MCVFSLSLQMLCDCECNDNDDGKHAANQLRADDNAALNSSQAVSDSPHPAMYAGRIRQGKERKSVLGWPEGEGRNLVRYRYGWKFNWDNRVLLALLRTVRDTQF